MADQRNQMSGVIDAIAPSANLLVIDPLGSNVYGKQLVYQIPEGLGQEEEPESVDTVAELPIDEPCQKLGTPVIAATMMSPDPAYSTILRLFHQTEKWYNLMMLRSSLPVAGRIRETIDSFDVANAKLLPVYAMQTLQSTSAEPRTIRFKADSHSPIIRDLAFLHTKDMFTFQQALTGYTVVHDCSRVLTTCQESRLFGGRRRQDLCRLQIWTTWHPKAQREGLSPTPLIAQPSLNLSQGSTVTQRPPNNPWSSHSRGGSTFTLPMPPSGPGPNYAPSITSNTISESSSTLTGYPLGSPIFSGVAGPPPIAPISPCLVLFAHRITSIERPSETVARSFLIIDITPDTTIDGESQNRHLEGPSNTCVLESKAGSGSGYLTARKSQETADIGQWDLASVGLHKRQTETERVKKLKHLIIQFEESNDMSLFRTKFEQVRDLAKLRLASFLEVRV